MQRGGGPGEHAAPGVAGQVCPAFAERAHETGDVTGERPRVVAARGLVRIAVPAQIRRDRVEAGVGQGTELVAPGPPELREPVQQQHRRPGARLGDVQADAVGRYVTVGPRPVNPDRGRIGRPHFCCVQEAGSRRGLSAAAVSLRLEIVRSGALSFFTLR